MKPAILSSRARGRKYVIKRIYGKVLHFPINVILKCIMHHARIYHSHIEENETSALRGVREDRVAVICMACG
jgi:hypothetical protein